MISDTRCDSACPSPRVRRVFGDAVLDCRRRLADGGNCRVSRSLAALAVAIARCETLPISVNCS